MADEQTQVLVVGAGLAGLSAAMFLAQRGIDVIAVERRPSSSPHPRATGQNPRTMELLRGAGVADDVLAAGLDTPSEPANTFDTSAISPAPWGHAAQNRVEPILLKRAEEFGADVWFSTELVSFEQDAYGVTARLMDKWSERISTVRADYLIAADGYRGAVRGRLGVARDGLGTLANRIGVLFEANLADHVDEHTVSFDYHPNLGESLLDFTAERLTGLIRVALDDPELDVKLLAVQPSEIAAGVVNDFRVGRIFLTGDAAAVSPPATGLGGGDTAVADGFDLAWKLAAVLHGEAGPALLNSYPAERRPFAELVMNAALHDPRAGTPPELDLSVLPEPIDPVRLMFGYRHRSGAVILEDDDPALAEDPCHPTGRPGYRAPHVPLRRDGVELSTVDLFGLDWVLLAGERGAAWLAAADRVAAELGVPLRACGLGPALVDSAGRAAMAYGIGADGVSLVRPDGVVAWRCGTVVDDPEAALRTVLTRLLDRPAM